MLFMGNCKKYLLGISFVFLSFLRLWSEFFNHQLKGGGMVGAIESGGAAAVSIEAKLILYIEAIFEQTPHFAFLRKSFPAADDS